MRLVVAIATLVAIGAPALAQTNTNCMFVGSQMFCNTSAPPPVYTPPVYSPPQYGISPNLMGLLIARRQAQIEAQREQEAADEAAEAQADDAQQVVDFHKSLGALIEAGKCDEARTMALDAGRLDDAALVAQACAKPVAPR